MSRCTETLEIVTSPLPFLSKRSSSSHVCERWTVSCMMGIVGDFVLKFARPSLMFDRRLCALADKVTAVIAAFLRNVAERFICGRPRKPTMQQYGADCTPLKTQTIRRRRWCDLSVVRDGRDTAEYLVQRLFIIDARHARCVSFLEPSKLVDKTASRHLLASLHVCIFPANRGARWHACLL